MVLIMFCGYPSSGKTTRATQLAQILSDQGRKTLIINEESLGLDRSQCYKGASWDQGTYSALQSG